MNAIYYYDESLGLFVPVSKSNKLPVDSHSLLSNITFWDNNPVLTTVFQPFTITNFNVEEWEIYNDSATNYIIYSFDGNTIHGKLKAGEIKVEPLKKQSIYLAGEIANTPYRLWARG